MWKIPGEICVNRRSFYFSLNTVTTQIFIRKEIYKISKEIAKLIYSGKAYTLKDIVSLSLSPRASIKCLWSLHTVERHTRKKSIMSNIAPWVQAILKKIPRVFQVFPGVVVYYVNYFVSRNFYISISVCPVRNAFLKNTRCVHKQKMQKLRNLGKFAPFCQKIELKNGTRNMVKVISSHNSLNVPN